jgi:hypothetical protein
MRWLHNFSLALFAGLAPGLSIFAQVTPPPGLNALPEVEFSQLTQSDTNPLSAKALAIHPGDWKHGETEHFIYHYQKSYVATAVSVEAEFHFRVIVKELAKTEVPWPEKAHIYIFEQPSDWAAFQFSGALEQWTGAIQSRASLFIVRNPAYKFSDNSLGHEITHLVVYRFYGNGLPLWLNEGLAQFASKTAHASFRRARGYAEKPTSQPVTTEKLFPLSQLAVMPYPPSEQVVSFYDESEKLVRFLVAADRTSFLNLIEVLAKGASFEQAISQCFGAQFPDLKSLESSFRTYAAKESVSTVENR